MNGEEEASETLSHSDWMCEAVVERIRTRFRGQVLDTFLLYLFTYEMPIERVRGLLDKVETQALRGFPDLSHASWRAEAAEELRDRWLLIENSMAARARKGFEKQADPPGREPVGIEPPADDSPEPAT